jgi:hypothetical protein
VTVEQGSSGASLSQASPPSSGIEEDVSRISQASSQVPDRRGSRKEVARQTPEEINAFGESLADRLNDVREQEFAGMPRRPSPSATPTSTTSSRSGPSTDGREPRCKKMQADPVPFVIRAENVEVFN